jgi:hypothetical protein
LCADCLVESVPELTHQVRVLVTASCYLEVGRQLGIYEKPPDQPSLKLGTSRTNEMQ